MIPALLAIGAALPACSLPAGWSAVEARHAPYLVLGESHGEEQGPATLAALACALSGRGERLLVALEQDASVDAALHAAWALSDSGDFAIALPKALNWQGRQDGIASRAMLAALVRLHRLKQEGRAIDLVAFNGQRDDAQAERFKDLPGQGPHEAMQADNIRQVALAQPYDHVLVLVGNAHARKRPIDGHGPRYEPMAMRLAAPGEVASILVATGAGTSWSCQAKPGFTPQPGKPITSDGLDCGAHNSRSSAREGRSWTVRAGGPQGRADGGYDFTLYAGPARASPPVLPGTP